MAEEKPKAEVADSEKASSQNEFLHFIDEHEKGINTLLALMIAIIITGIGMTLFSNSESTDVTVEDAIVVSEDSAESAIQQLLEKLENVETLDEEVELRGLLSGAYLYEKQYDKAAEQYSVLETSGYTLTYEDYISLAAIYEAAGDPVSTKENYQLALDNLPAAEGETEEERSVNEAVRSLYESELKELIEAIDNES